MNVPAYCRHAATGLAFVVVRESGKRRFVYLGPFGSDESRKRYAAVVSAVTAGAPLPRFAAAGPLGTTVADAAGRWLAHCRVYYRRPDGTAGREVESNALSFRELLALAAARPAASLGKADLAAARDRMVAAGLCRRVVNQRLGRLRRAFRWLADEGVVPDGVAAAAAAVRPLPPHRSPAAERPPIEAVAAETVAATKRELHPVVAAMVELQWLTGMRPGEVRLLRKRHCVGVCGAAPGAGAAIDFGCEHKTGYRGRRRVVPLGPLAAAVLAPFAAACDGPDAFVFSPRTAPRGRNRKRLGYYTRTAYCNAIYRACDRAGVARWHPHRLRHAYAERVRAAYGLDAARALLGHAGASTTEIYCSRDDAIARRIADELG